MRIDIDNYLMYLIILSLVIVLRLSNFFSSVVINNKMNTYTESTIVSKLINIL